MSNFPVTDIIDMHGGVVRDAIVYMVDDDTVDYMELWVEFGNSTQAYGFREDIDPLLSRLNPSQHIADGPNGEQVIVFYI